METFKDYPIKIPQTYTCSFSRTTAEARKKAAKGLKGISFEIIREEGSWQIGQTLVEDLSDLKEWNRRLREVGVLPE